MATHQWLTLSGANRSALRICTRREEVKMLWAKWDVSLQNLTKNQNKPFIFIGFYRSQEEREVPSYKIVVLLFSLGVRKTPTQVSGGCFVWAGPRWPGCCCCVWRSAALTSSWALSPVQDQCEISGRSAVVHLRMHLAVCCKEKLRVCPRVPATKDCFPRQSPSIFVDLLFFPACFLILGHTQYIPIWLNTI